MPLSDPASAEAGLWLSLTDLAARKGVTKQTVAERVARFEGQGLLETRPGKGKAKLVNLAEFDRLAGETTDLGREQGAATRRAAQGGGIPGTDPVYTQEQARKMAYSADREKIALGEDLDRLVPVDRLREEAARILAPVVTRLDRLETRADELAAAVARDGIAGGRAWLRAFKVEVRNDLADALALLVAELLAEPHRPLDSFDPRIPAVEEPDAIA